MEKILFIQDKQLLKKSARIYSILSTTFALLLILSSPVFYIVFQNKFDKVAIVQEQDINHLKSLNEKSLDGVVYRLELNKNFFQFLVKVAVFIQFFVGLFILQSSLLKLKLHKKLNKADTITSTRSE